MNHTSYTRREFPVLRQCLEVGETLRKKYPLWISSAFWSAEFVRTKDDVYLYVHKKKQGRRGLPRPEIFTLSGHIISIIEAITGEPLPDAIEPLPDELTGTNSNYREAVDSFLALDPICFPFIFEGVFAKPIEEMLVQKGLKILKDKGIDLNEGLPGH